MTLRNFSDETGKLDVQGPQAAALLQKFTDTDLAQLKYYHATQGPITGVPCRISRTGYTGEDGFELFFPIDANEQMWNLFVAERGRAMRPGRPRRLAPGSQPAALGQRRGPPGQPQPGLRRLHPLRAPGQKLRFRRAGRPCEAFAADGGCAERMINLRSPGAAWPATATRSSTSEGRR